MNAYEKIRAALEMREPYAPLENDRRLEALAALAELERAAAEPVAWRLPTTPKQQFYDVGPWEYRTNPPGRKKAQPLYTAPPPAPVAEMRDAERYRWLRRKAYIVGLHHLSDNDCGQFEFANLPRILEPMAGVGNAANALDVVIDAALSETNP